jgi:hypothetical protein
VEELVEHINDPVVPQRHLFLLAFGVLDDGHEVPAYDLALCADHAVEPEWGQLGRAGFDGDESKVEVLVGEEKGGRREREELTGRTPG